MSKSGNTRPKEPSYLEQVTMLAILRQHPSAYGVSISDEIEKATSKTWSLGSIYAALDRLEGNGFVSRRTGEATSARGGRAKTYFTLTGQGRLALAASLQALQTMSEGIDLAGAPACA